MGESTVKKGWDKAYFDAPDQIYDVTNISGYAKCVYLYLCRCADSKAQSYPSHAKIAGRTGFSISTVRRAIEELIEVGLLTKGVRSNGGASNLYTLIHPNDANNVQFVEKSTKNKNGIVSQNTSPVLTEQPHCSTGTTSPVPIEQPPCSVRTTKDNTVKDDTFEGLKQQQHREQGTTNTDVVDDEHSLSKSKLGNEYEHESLANQQVCSKTEASNESKESEASKSSPINIGNLNNGSQNVLSYESGDGFALVRDTLLQYEVETKPKVIRDWLKKQSQEIIIGIIHDIPNKKEPVRDWNAYITATVKDFVPKQSIKKVQQAKQPMAIHAEGIENKIPTQQSNKYDVFYQYYNQK